MVARAGVDERDGGHGLFSGMRSHKRQAKTLPLGSLFISLIKRQQRVLNGCVVAGQVIVIFTRIKSNHKVHQLAVIQDKVQTGHFVNGCSWERNAQLKVTSTSLLITGLYSRRPISMEDVAFIESQIVARIPKYMACGPI